MINILSSNYLTRKPVEKAVQDFARHFEKNKRVLDIGCGNKPYADFFVCEYIGLDPYLDTKADVVRDAWDTGLESNSFDGIMLNQSLEHIPRTEETIAEVKRLLKPGGLVLVTVPQTMRHHSVPISSAKAPYHNFDTQQIPYWNEDYWRFTKFGLIRLFQDFSILSLRPNQSYLVTLFQLWNYFLASFGLGIFFAPLYGVNNILALVAGSMSRLFGRLSPRYQALIHEALTIDHTLIATKR